MIDYKGRQQVGEIDWARWQARELATLVFLVEGKSILLIRKKRGLGAGKINGPGGKLDPGETLEQCAVRECEEEVGITPRALEYCGQNLFQFVDGYSIHVWTYRADAYDGSPVETAEAIPIWFDLDAIPLDEMWDDDRHWLPLVLEGQRFVGRYVVDGDRLLDHAIELDEERANGEDWT